MKLLRKLNTKIAIRLMLVLIVSFSIVGTFRLYELLQKESNLSIPSIIVKLSFAYLIPITFCLTLLIFALSYTRQSKISFKAFKRSVIVALFSTLFLPGFLVFPEVYGFNNVVLILPMSSALIIVSLARFFQKYTDEQIRNMISKLFFSFYV